MSTVAERMSSPKDARSPVRAALNEALIVSPFLTVTVPHSSVPAPAVGVAELMAFNKNLLFALKHEREGIDFYTKFLDEANDERGREMYRKLIEEERRHLKMVQDEIEEHKKQGYWS